jgi:hypothetical protein
MKKTIRRAITRERSTEADCPINSTCLYRDELTGRLIRCGWYGGSRFDRVGGVTITCNYNERSQA